MSKKNRCSFRTHPANRTSRKKSHTSKPNWRKIFFQATFKVIETVWMIVQIIQYLSEMARK